MKEENLSRSLIASVTTSAAVAQKSHRYDSPEREKIARAVMAKHRIALADLAK